MGCPAWHPSSRRHRRVAHGRGRCRTLWETDSRFISARARTRVHTRTRSFRPCLLAYLSDSDSRRCRSTIALSLSLSSSLSFFPNAPNAISRDFSKRVFYSSLRNRAASCETRDALDERKKRKEEEKEQKRGRNQRSSVIWIFAACA